MNAGEYGIVHNILTGFDMSGSSAVSITYTRPNGTSFTASAPDVVVGSAPTSNGYVSFPANQYVSYVFKNGDISIPGDYTARAMYNDATKHLIASTVTFTVNP